MPGPAAVKPPTTKERLLARRTRAATSARLRRPRERARASAGWPPKARREGGSGEGGARGWTVEAVISRSIVLDADKVQFTGPGQASALAGPPNREPVRSANPF